MAAMVTFSIITPVYNGQDFIRETIDSVLNAASKFKFEYLVVDDGSTDNTHSILLGYGENITVIRQENAGQSSAITNAIGLATGEYLLIVNADDPLINSDLFRDAKEVLDNDTGTVATYPDWIMIDKSGNEVETVLVKDFSIEELVGRFNCLIGPGGIFRRVAAQEIRGWDKNFKYVPDYDFWLRLVDYGRFQHIPKVQATWRTHSQSISIGSRGVEMAEERIRVIENYVSRHPETPEKIRKMALANSSYRAAILSYFDQRVQGKKLMLSSIKMHSRILIEKDVRVIVFLLCMPVSGYVVKKLTKLFSLVKLEDKLRRSIKG
jgi:glycosyltransferase involved in cell wall biosynthesis